MLSKLHRSRNGRLVGEEVGPSVSAGGSSLFPGWSEAACRAAASSSKFQRAVQWVHEKINIAFWAIPSWQPFARLHIVPGIEGVPGTPGGDYLSIFGLYKFTTCNLEKRKPAAIATLELSSNIGREGRDGQCSRMSPETGARPNRWEFQPGNVPPRPVCPCYRGRGPMTPLAPRLAPM